MPAHPLRVLIIGGGLGGLALAQALHHAGMDVTVFERDRHRADRPQGYRLHINPAGSRALSECLRPELFDAFTATCGRGPRMMTFCTEGLAPLLTVDADAKAKENPDRIGRHRSVSRDTLRQVLLAGLGDVISYGKTFTDYQHQPDGSVTALFADGTSATGNVLVGADGGNSRVRRRYLPHAERVDTGMRTIAGKLPFSPSVSELLPGYLLDGPVAVNAPGGVGMFLAAQQFQRPPERLIRDFGLDPAEDFVSWGLGARRERFEAADRATIDGADGIEPMDGAALRAVVLTMISDWHPRLQELVRRTDPATVTSTSIYTSVPIHSWPTTNITLLGDAIHSMTPARGVGANTALRDAANLSDALIAAGRGDEQTLDAIRRYETAMTGYGFDAVRASARSLRQQTSMDSRVALTAGRTALRLLNAVPPLKRKAFANLGE